MEKFSPRVAFYEEDIDIGLVYDFIYIEGIKLRGNNTYKISTDKLNTQDYIKVADYVITKSGWTTVVEAICARKPMIY